MATITVKQALPRLRKIVFDGNAEKIGRSVVDVFTANAILKVYDALTPSNRERLELLPVPLAATVSFRLLTSART